MVGRPLRRLVALLPCLSFTLASGTAAQSEPLWRYTAPAKIRGFQVTPLGSLLVQTDSGTVTLDPDSGSTIWARSDMRWISLISRTALALTWLDPGGPVLWDLESGRALTDSLPFESVRGLITLPERGLVLVHGPTAESPATLAAISLDSAGIRWRQDSLFSRVVREPDHFKKLSLTGQPPIVDQDSGVILYPNYGGPIKLDLFSGALRWRAESLANRDPPTRRDGWAPPLLHQGVLYVPYEKRMMALRSSDGQILWDRQDKLEGRAFQLAHTPHGLLVLTVPGPNDVGMIHDPAPGLELLDPGTGASVWPKRISRLGGTGLFLARGDSAYISAKNKLFALHLPSGVLLEERKLEFEGGEDAGRIEPWNGGLLIQGHQNLLLLDSLGGEVYFRYFKAPGKSLFAKIASTALIVAFNVASYSVTPPGGMYTVITNNPVLTARYHATERARDYVYMLTSEPDASGRTGFSLVRVHRADGSETGRVWVDDRSPDMALDPITGTVFLKTSDTQIVALRF